MMSAMPLSSSRFFIRFASSNMKSTDHACSIRGRLWSPAPLKCTVRPSMNARIRRRASATWRSSFARGSSVSSQSEIRRAARSSGMITSLWPARSVTRRSAATERTVSNALMLYRSLAYSRPATSPVPATWSSPSCASPPSIASASRSCSIAMGTPLGSGRQRDQWPVWWWRLRSFTVSVHGTRRGVSVTSCGGSDDGHVTVNSCHAGRTPKSRSASSSFSPSIGSTSISVRWPDARAPTARRSFATPRSTSALTIASARFCASRPASASRSSG